MIEASWISPKVTHSFQLSELFFTILIIKDMAIKQQLGVGTK